MRVIPSFLAGFAVFAFALASGVRAETPGWYMGMESGWSHLSDPSSTPTVGAGSLGSFTARPSEGYAVGGKFGYSGVFLPDLRAEGELVYRSNNLSSVSGPFLGPTSTMHAATGSIDSFGLMANLIYDFKNTTPWTPYIGGGVGAAALEVINAGVPSMSSVTVRDTEWEFAYQAIAGVSYTFNRNWSASLDYRYFATLDPTFHTTIAGLPASAKTQYSTHNVMVGFTYHFAPLLPPPHAAPAAPVAQPASIPPPPPQTFIVYFDFDRSNLTADGARVVQDAAAAFKTTGFATVTVTGHTDLAGTQLYNLALSKRRADTVRAELVKDGVPTNLIVESWHGKESPAVPTADGVREARNRRVEIVL
jgi:OmpA-OmpF porin, OOP family